MHKSAGLAPKRAGLDKCPMAESLRQHATRLVETRIFQATVLVLILANAVILGLETLEPVRRATGQTLVLIDRAIIYAFVVEIALRVYSYRREYFTSGWNIFDFLVVFISLFAASSGFGAFRAFRVLRVLRVVTVIPRMRVVVSALLDAIPGIASVGLVIVLIVYVFGVIAATLYGPAHPQLFGDVFRAMYTLFQVMTLEGWPDIAEEVGRTHPRSWIFFLAFVLIATFTMLNLFVAIVVRVIEEDSDPWFDDLLKENCALRKDVAAMREEIAALSRRFPD